MVLNTPKAAEVFAIPELLELILLSLPATTAQLELSSIRTVLLCQTVCTTWRCLVRDSRRVRAFCYLPAHSSQLSSSSSAWDVKSPSPANIRHNPYISSLLLRHRHWGGVWPFNGNQETSLYGSTAPQRWSFFFEVSRSEFSRFPAAGPWRDVLVTDPPFREVWCARTPQMTAIDSLLYKASEYELETGDLDEDEEVWTAKMEAECRRKAYLRLRGKQNTRRCCEGGFTLGDIVDVVADMFENDSKAEWVVLESVRQDDLVEEHGSASSSITGIH